MHPAHVSHRSPPIVFVYINHRGEKNVRKVIVHHVKYGTTEYYPEPCWLLHGLDVEKNAERTFKMANIVGFIEDAS